MRTSLLGALLAGFGIAVLSAATAAAEGTPDPAEIHRQIDRLGSAKFSEREEATAALDAAGEAALPELRQAAEADDAEVRRRAVDLVGKIERRVETEHLLAPTKVKLVFKNTSLPEAVAELSKQSGYAVALRDPGGKLKDRKITLNTGEMSFWEALDRLCAKGRLVEESTLPPPVTVAVGGAPPPIVLAPGVMPPPVMAGGAGRMVQSRPMVPYLGQLTLVDSGAGALATAYAGAVCVRGQRMAGTRGESSLISLDLVIAAEPKIRSQDSFSLRIDKVVDDQGQELSPADDSLIGPIYMAFNRRNPVPYTSGFSVQHLQTRLNAGDKPSKSLREIHGTLSTRVYTEPRPVLAAEDVLNTVGKTFAGSDGGSIKVLEATKGTGGHLTLRLELVMPPEQGAEGLLGVVPVRPAGRVRVIAAPPIGAVPPAAAPAVAPVPAAASSVGRRVGGISLLDDKGNSFRPTGMRVIPRDARGVLREYTVEFDLPQGRQAARVVLNASKTVGVEVPFTIKDLPLP